MSNKTLEMNVESKFPVEVRSLLRPDGSFEFESLLNLKNVSEDAIIDYWTGRVTIAHGAFDLRETVRAMFDHMYNTVFDDAFDLAKDMYQNTRVATATKKTKTKSKTTKKTKRSRK